MIRRHSRYNRAGTAKATTIFNSTAALPSGVDKMIQRARAGWQGWIPTVDMCGFYTSAWIELLFAEPSWD